MRVGSVLSFWDISFACVGNEYESNMADGDEYEVEHEEADVGVVLNSSGSTDEDDDELLEHLFCLLNEEESLWIGFEWWLIEDVAVLFFTVLVKSIDRSEVIFSR